MRRLPLLALLLVLVAPGVASAHPLGNFSVNHLDVVSVSSDRVDVRYVLDQAEIPTFQERGKSAAEVLAAKRDEVLRGLALTVDGRPVPLSFAGDGRIAFPEGQGGLKTTRVELRLRAPVDDPERVTLVDRTFEDRVGWSDVIVRPGEGTSVRSSVPASEPTNELRSYPEELLSSPLDRRSATLEAEPGDGSVIAPRQNGDGLATTADRGGGGFAGIFDDAASGHGVLLLLLLAAFGWGALHALSPGHGKAMVAAYLVGSQGTARQAVMLGATVTVTHTIGVFALGFVALALSAYVLPEDLYPWLNLVAGLLVVAVGAGVLRSRMRGEPEGHHHHHHHDGDGHHHHHHHHHHGDGHHHHHHHHEEPERTTRGVLALGAAAGLIPCPSALVVLLGAIAQHEIALGLLLIVAFSLGLAATLTVLGLAVVWSTGAVRKLDISPRVRRIGAVIPALSALLIVGVGVVLTAQAIPLIVS